MRVAEESKRKSLNTKCSEQSRNNVSGPVKCSEGLGRAGGSANGTSFSKNPLFPKPPNWDSADFCDFGEKLDGRESS